MRPQHVAGLPQRRQPVGARDRHRRGPRVRQYQVGDVGGAVARVAHAVDQRQRRRQRLARGADLGEPVGRHVGDELGQLQPAGARVLDAVEQFPQDTETAGHETAGVAGVDARREHPDGQIERDHPAQ
ncbi:hypothetical protein GCM10009676_40620 [Prauserella halophila]|uniref:Uncharacterized protein n=1 Tax=Prauserella halophila TaxID=185641 RepID=A0ABN1WIT6_9PSEU